ncbi:phage tail protein [Streptococcus suis]|uniref:phage tail protein n=1 Tax=Streptococcus suis TaxID=1307 RepID=UPI0004149F55|nr:phage tail protein [Streptococcus suis]
MYAVSLINGANMTPIHDSMVGGNKLLSAIVKFEINKIAQFDFQFLPNNAGYKALIKPLQTMVQVVNMRTGREVFYGRIAPITNDMAESGVFTFAYNAKSELDFLNDSKQRQQIYRGKKSDFVKQVLQFHNDNLEAYKEFLPGDLTDLIATGDYMEADVDPAKSTFATLTDLILNEYGLELQIRKENGKRYLDFKRQIGIDSDTEIKLSVNLLSLKQHINPEGIVSRLLVYGKQNSETNQRVNIASVNNGKDYIDRPDLIAEYGIKMETATFDDIEDPVALKQAGESQLATQKAVAYQYSVSAVNLSHINPNFDEFEEGNTYRVINPVMFIDERLRVVARQIDLVNVERSNLTIGDKFKSAEEWQLDNVRRRTKQLVTTRQLKEQQSQLEEVRVIASTTAETVETVSTAVSEQSSQLLSAQDKQKLDYLLVTKEINLDELITRVEALERK